MEDSDEVLKRIEQSKTIETLNLSNLQLKALPSQLISLVHLKYLFLDNNKLIFVPEVGSLVNLEELSIENNEFTLIPEVYYNLKNLKSLNLSKNSLKMLSSKMFESYQNLSILWLNGCGLMHLPKEIRFLKFLEKLGLKDNCLPEVPEEMGELVNLKWLNLEKNEIEILPESFAKLKKLKHLNLAYNRLGEIPRFFIDFKNLNILLLRGNQIKNFTDEFALGLSYLNKCDLRDNLFVNNLKTTNADFFNQILTIDNFLIQN
ncbi:leucine-rich repeat SHOC-2-like [Brachionus plicatilis]|uniref:Leucine-rich repeat SHOC-2-like n=1 Tax=Brachionus plicatilis TaxID=10195 RepID=A0A3M7SWC4_BRAPC|nr:leucine-rich repeat SHOC-2-like [Brachionus plicatilis]